MRALPWIACLLLVGCTAAAEKAAPPADAGSPGTDWPKFLGPLGTGVSNEKGILSPWPKQGPRVVWHEPLGIGYGAPAISDGRPWT